MGVGWDDFGVEIWGSEVVWRRWLGCVAVLGGGLVVWRRWLEGVVVLGGGVELEFRTQTKVLRSTIIELRPRFG
jgi:hypothetical protein